MENFTKEIKSLIVKNIIRDIQIELLKAEMAGLVPNYDRLNGILKDIEEKLGK